jgi:hypothetical protein
MKTWIVALALTFIPTQYSLTQNMEVHQDVPVKAFSEGERGYQDPAVVDTKYLEVKLMKIEGFSGAELTKMNAALEVLEEVVNSETFKEKVINFKNTKGQRAFASNLGLSNEAIYERFMDGREMLLQNTPGEMNFYLKLYNSWWSKVVGWTNPDINTININKKFFKNYRPNEVAGNLAHEWTHKIGFDHVSAAEHDSAPYAIGYIVEDLARKVLAGQSL